MSRRSHDLPGRSGNPVAGQRAAGGTFQNGFELVGHVMYKSCLILRAMEWFSGKPSAINVARSVWEGADERAAMVPRQPPTSFGKGRMKKGQQWYLVSRLLHSVGGRRKRAKQLVPRRRPTQLKKGIISIFRGETSGVVEAVLC